VHAFPALISSTPPLRFDARTGEGETMHPIANINEPRVLDATQKRCEQARELLEQAALDRALELLEGIAEGDRTAAVYVLIGTARFRKEQYDQAEAQLRRAIEMGAKDREVTDLLALASANVVSGIQDQIPQRYDFERSKLLAGPQPGTNGAHKPRVLRRSKPTLLEKGLVFAGTVTGVVLGRGLGVAARAIGSEAKGEVWTTWSRHNFARAMLMLARRRARLNKENLYDAYPKGTLVAFVEPGKEPPSRARVARTSDGSWNDLHNPMAGAAGTRFGYNADPHRTAPEKEDGTLMVPNPRTVSRVLFTRDDGPDGMKKIPFLNLLAGAWIQFMNHDWVSYGDPSTTKFYKIPLDKDDPARKRLHQTHMFVGATQDDPTSHPDDPTTPHINEVTSWWDGSQIYGSDEATVRGLRSGVDGKLRLDAKTGNLPIAKDGVEDTGFRRNWWLGLSMLHLLFVKEHNSICDMLKVKYPQWDDDQLFDTARLINAAVMAKIHTVEWTPAVLPNPVLNTAMHSNWFGALTQLFRSKDHRKAVATFDVDDPILGGVVGNKAQNFGVPYSLTREFLSVYRLHSLLPDEVTIDALDGSRSPQTLPLAKLRMRGAHKISDSTPMADLLYSFGIRNPGQLVLNNFPRTLQNLSIPGMGFYDLGAVDVLRDRERGTPRYNQFRRLLGLNPIRRFEDLTDDPDQVRKLREVYHNDIEQIDLLVGNLAESTRPAFFGFGETLFEVFIINATRRLQADRFYTDDYREEIYTPAGLAWVDEVTFKQVLLRHYPELGKTGLANVENGFEPWDVGELTPDRHPLRQYEKSLQEELVP
jgi:hypothetical protein